ncbi:MAG: hypothetical protein LAN71_08750 [Acidobacteriia bacterium]|nr:hypothetical protein [Terriglobia bacterium]
MGARNWLRAMSAGGLLAAWLLAAGARAQTPPQAVENAKPDAAVAELVRRAGVAAEELTAHLAMVRYQEHISQYKIRGNNKVEYEQEAFYDSLLLVHDKNGRMSAEEMLEEEKAPGRFEQRPLLMTRGFSTMALIVHPYYARSFRFVQEEEEVAEGRQLVRLHFEHIKGEDSPTVLRLRGRNYALGMAGTVWIDAESGAVARIRGELSEPMEDIGLHRLNCEVRYALVELEKSGDKYWLPVVANVDLETPKQHWRNVHEFAKYRRYAVKVKLGS